MSAAALFDGGAGFRGRFRLFARFRAALDQCVAPIGIGELRIRTRGGEEYLLCFLA